MYLIIIFTSAFLIAIGYALRFQNEAVANLENNKPENPVRPKVAVGSNAYVALCVAGMFFFLAITATVGTLFPGIHPKNKVPACHGHYCHQLEVSSTDRFRTERKRSFRDSFVVPKNQERENLQNDRLPDLPGKNYR